MKKLFLTATITLACVAAFAQGKVRFNNDSLHLIYFTTDTGSLLNADVGLAGQAVPANGAGSMGAGVTLAVDLWAGTSAASLAKVATTSIAAAGGTPGSFISANIILPFAGGAGQFFQVQVYDASSGSYAGARAAQFKYYGESAIFNATSSAGTPYYSIVQTTSPANSTWAVGTYDVSASTGLAGAQGAIMMVANVPEPTSMALAGLGAAALLIFRRRK